MIVDIQPSHPNDSAAAVVAHVRQLIDSGSLGPGARLPPERDLAREVGVSRPTVRAGLRTLAALGVVRSRRGSGTYIPDGPPTLGADAPRAGCCRARRVRGARATTCPRGAAVSASAVGEGQRGA